MQTRLKKGLYQHYKGSLYRVLDVATHSESQEELVIYQALYGEKGMWARPLTMFTETVLIDGTQTPRFAFCEMQSQVLEVMVLDVKVDETDVFEKTFEQAQSIISSMTGYIDHDLQRCLETKGRYILLVNWQSLENHTEGFRGSEQYQQWRDLLHHFHQPFPVVEHYKTI